jgi:hypothetical protein
MFWVRPDDHQFLPGPNCDELSVRTKVLDKQDPPASMNMDAAQ